MLNLDDEKLKQGFVWFWRSFIEWEWFTEVNTCHLFQYCILRANHSNTEWRGIKIKRGSFVTSLDSLSVSTGLTVREVRTALKNLKKTKEIEVETTSRYSIITVKNYNSYQYNDKQNGKQITNERQTSDKQATTDNNELIMNNNEEEVGKKNPPASAPEYSEDNSERLADIENWYGEYGNVHLTKHQYDKLYTFILSKELLTKLINQLSENIASKKDKAKPYDEKFPQMHYIALKKYFQQMNVQKNNEEKGEYSYGY